MNFFLHAELIDLALPAAKRTVVPDPLPTLGVLLAALSRRTVQSTARKLVSALCPVFNLEEEERKKKERKSV